MQRNDYITANAANAEEPEVAEVQQPGEASKRARRIRMAGKTLYILGMFLSCAVAAHAQADPFTNTAQTWEAMLTGTFAQMVTVSGIVLAGVPLVTGQAGDHKGKLIGAIIGGATVLCAQRIVSTLLPAN